MFVSLIFFLQLCQYHPVCHYFYDTTLELQGEPDDGSNAESGSTVFRFSVFAISIPQLRAHAGAVAGSRLVRRDLHSFCFSSVPPTAARPGSAPQATCYSAVLRIRATFKARLERCLGVWSGPPERARRRVFRLPDLLVRPTRPRASSRRRRRLVEFASFNNLVGWRPGVGGARPVRPPRDRGVWSRARWRSFSRLIRKTDGGVNEEIIPLSFLLFFMGIEPATTAGAPFWEF